MKGEWKNAQRMNTIDTYHDFLKNYPESKYKIEAEKKLLTLEWAKAKKIDTIKSYEDFLALYPNEVPLSTDAKTKIGKLRLESAWKLATTNNTIKSYEDFLALYPKEVPLNGDARARIKELQIKGFMQAAMTGDSSTLKDLLDNHTIDVNVTDSEGYTALHKACKAGNLHAVHLLLQRGATVNAFVYNNQKEINRSISFNRSTGIVDHEFGIGATPLLFACENGSADIVKLLIKYKANVNLGGKEGFEDATPLCKAVQKGNTEIIKILIANKAGVNVKGAPVLIENLRTATISMGLATPMEIAKRLGRKQIVQLLLKAGAVE